MNDSQPAGNSMDVLYPEVRSVASLPIEDRDRMFGLFCGYFANVRRCPSRPLALDEGR